ncbi:MAG: OmpA family protein [Bacteroidota bacterium]
MRTFLIWLFLGWSPLLAQDHILFHDDFTLDAFRWPLGLTDSSEAVLQQGQLHLGHHSLEGELLFTHEIHLQNQKNFSFSTTLTQVPGTSSASYGLCWSANAKGDQYYAFLIKPEGFFAIAEVKSGNPRFLQNWQKHRKIKAQGEPNELMIRKSGWRLYFSINGKEVAELDFPKMRGRYHGLTIWQQAELQVDHFTIHHPPIDILEVNDAILNAIKRPLDSTINQPHTHETAGHINAAGDHLYFTRSDSADGLQKGDIWWSDVAGDSMWGPAFRMGAPLNQAQRSEVVKLSRNERTAWIGMNQRGQPPMLTQSQGSGDAALWQPPTNSYVLEDGRGSLPNHWFLSQDGQTLVFSGQLKDCYGESDLYVSFRKDGRWTRPRNLGPSINTFATEMTPYLSDDLQTLYFSSAGLPGYGEGDVYRSERKSNTWTQWSQPENLGANINGPAWDAFFHFLPNRPRHAYMASVDTTHGTYDLYGVRIPLDVREMPLVRVYGQVFNQTTGDPLGSEVQSLDLSVDSLAKRTPAQSNTGAYSMFLPYGKAYEIFAERVGYFAVIDTLDVRAVEKYREVQMDLYLRPIEIGTTIQLDRLYFHRASAEMVETSYPELNQLVRLMRAIPTLEIEIRGHTDNIGNEQDLWTLSDRRAEVVRQYLITNGITDSRMSSQGFGGSQPIASNAHPDTRKLNRRVEFYVVRR